jgi:hypothetical protein
VEGTEGRRVDRGPERVQSYVCRGGMRAVERTEGNKRDRGM